MEDKKRIAQENFFNLFYEKNFKKMFAYANAIVENHDLAEEVVQDAYLEALKQLDFLVGTELPERWLQQVVKHKALHAKRTQMRDKWRLAELNEGLIPDSSAEKELREVESADAVNEINSILEEKLKPMDLTLLRKISAEGASFKSVSADTGLSLSACQKRVQRARKKLEKYFPFR